jgi:hypothetical protein
MKKHAAVVDKLLRDYLPDGVRVYRGHLRMPPDAPPDDHKRAKKAFCRSMRRWAERRGVAFEVHAVQHITDPHNCHWDTVCYSDAPRTALRAAVSSAWERAGGLRQSLVPLDPDEIGGACKYQSKDVKPEIRRGTHYLPVAQGMKYHWSSAGFWRDHAIDDLWKECIAEWFPDKVPDDVPSNRRDTCLEPPDPPDAVPNMVPESPVVAAVREANPWLHDGSKQVSLLLDDVAKSELLAEIDRRLDALPRRNAEEVFRQLPTDPSQAVKPEWIADDTGLPSGHVAYLLKNKLRQRGAAELPRVQGRGWYNERGLGV